MNSYDSERMADLMRPHGYEMGDDPASADLVILNTCHIREKATEKLYSELGRIKKARKKAGTTGILAVAGCVGQAEGGEIINRVPYVDLVVGPQNYHRLPEMVTKVMRDGGKAVEIDFPAVPKFDYLPEPVKLSASAFLTVQEGCDKFCSFCVVPYTRGAEYSRPVSDIIREAEKLAAEGVLEFNLLGQNVNAYHGADENGNSINLGDLIARLSRIDSVRRIRYTTSHPRDMHEELYRQHAENEKLMPYLHLPIQSGSNKILEKMNRKHSREEYLQIINRLRKLRPDIAFSTDIIVGFPGESEEDFQDTLQLVEEVGYASSYSFKYSPRPGTPAAALEAQVPEEVKAERLGRLQNLLMRQHSEFNKSMEGRILPVLFDREGSKPGQVLGRSPYMQSTYVIAGNAALNTIAQVTITGSKANSLQGDLINKCLP